MYYHKVEICGVNTAKLPVLKEKEKMELIVKAQAGDKEARQKMINGNLRLVLSVVQKFTGRGENLDDLFQVGCIGLIKAIDNFNPGLGLRFSTYGQPMIIGEIRRFLRDNNAMRVSRSVRDVAYKAMQARELLQKKLGREPNVREISEAVGLPQATVTLALESVVEPVSLYEPVYSDGGDTIYVMDQVGETGCEENWISSIQFRDTVSKLSDREVEQLLSNLEIKSFATRDEQEVAGYAELMDLVFSSWQGIPFTENHIKQLHQILLRYSEKDTWHRGNYKTNSNSVAAFDETGAQIGIVFQTASPFDTPRLMTELVAWVNQERETARLHPLLIIALCVVVFLEIHPFQDGNGRLSRVLSTLLLLQAGYAYVPYSSLESVVEQSKEAYYLALRQTQGTIRTDAPNWQPWLVFFLRSLAEQVRRLEKKVKREKIVLAAMPELQLQIVEFAREHGRVTIGEAIKLTGASRNTLKQHFRALVERGTLDQHGSGRGVWYGLR